MDGKPVAAGNYSAAAGSVDLSLKASYLESLSEKTHTLTAVFTDGKAETTFTVNARPVIPKTGDGSNPILWTVLMMVGLLGIGGLIREKRGSKGT